MLNDIRKLEIRQTLSDMARQKQHASALMWLSSLPIDEEDYGREVMEQVQFSIGGRVSVRNIWTPPAPKREWAGLQSVADRLGLSPMDLDKAMKDALKPSGLFPFVASGASALDLLNSFLPPPSTILRDVLAEARVYHHTFRMESHVFPKPPPIVIISP
jgi:hypothetical protein